VLDDAVRQVLCPEKIDTATWLEVVGQAHQQGLATTSTMLCGHIETPSSRSPTWSGCAPYSSRLIATNDRPASRSSFCCPLWGKMRPSLYDGEWVAISPA
jgi:hypothetical protein